MPTIALQQLSEAGGDDNRMAYKDMNYGLYLTVTLILYAAEMVGSIYIKDIEMIFNFVSAIAMTFIMFWFPGGFYLMAEKKFGTAETKSGWKHNVSIIFLILGFINSIAGLFAAVLNITKKF